MNQKILTLNSAYNMGRKRLAAAGVPEPDLDAWYLLEDITKINRTQYFMNPERQLKTEEEKDYLVALSKREKRIPLQHITGKQQFMGIEFLVNEHVLIPRQDTEILVEEALSKVKKGMKVLDMCTGSGCIVISMASFFKECEYSASDISVEALKIAKKNAQKNNTDITFIESDLFENVTEYYDLIVSNPPYIRTNVIKELQKEVKTYDPYIALDGKEDGLYFYRRIIEKSTEHLNDGGYLLFEIGHDQKEEVENILKENGYTEIFSKKDLAGLDRVVVGRYNK